MTRGAAIDQGEREWGPAAWATPEDERYRASRRTEWTAAGRAYGTLAASTLAELMTIANAAIFDIARLKPGERVLDLATGAGSPAIEAASQVAPGGSVLGIDSASTMVASARRRAVDEGVRNVTFEVMEAEQLDLAQGSFDVAISRYGLPHFTNSREALRETLRVLRPGGRLIAAMHGAVAKNPYFTAPVLALQKFHHSPEPITERGPFFYHDPGLLDAALRFAGFVDVVVKVVDGEVTIPDFTAYWESQKNGGAAVRRALDGVPAVRRDEAEKAALAALAPYVSGNRGVFPARIVVGSAWKGQDAI